jgi:hypothetical protein
VFVFVRLTSCLQPTGHMLPKPGAATKGEVIDPFVHVSVHGHAEDESDFKTRTINDNGFSPLWNEVRVCVCVCVCA